MEKNDEKYKSIKWAEQVEIFLKDHNIKFADVRLLASVHRGEIKSIDVEYVKHKIKVID